MSEPIDVILQRIETEIRNAAPRPNTRLTYDGGIGRAWRIVQAHRRALALGYGRLDGRLDVTRTDEMPVSDEKRKIIQDNLTRALHDQRTAETEGKREAL